jgi:cystathionine gamma-synthase
MTHPDHADGPGFETLAIHAGQTADPATGSVMMPFYAASTF